MLVRSFLLGALACTALACSGGAGATSPAQPSPSAASKAGPENSAKPRSEAPPGATASASAEPPRADTPASRLSRPVKDIITAPTVAFQFNFNNSEIHAAVEQRCVQESGGDPKANADCIQAAREKQGVVIHRFVLKGKTWFWTTHQRRGNQLVMMHKYAFEFGAETPDTIEIIPVGKDAGLAPTPAPKSVIIKCPDEFSIEMTDPKIGRMSFEGKLGLIPD